MRATTQTHAQRRADNATIRRALKVLEERLEYGRTLLSSPQDVRNFLQLRMAQLEREIFVALWMDARNKLIVCEELFRGTLTQSTVYPREVVKSALCHNAAAVIFAHNHPSGDCAPSKADKELTDGLKLALALVDVKVQDHFIVAGANPPLSFAERGLL